MNNITLLVDEGGKIAKMYDADHWLLPMPRWVYLIINKKNEYYFQERHGFVPAAAESVGNAD